MAYLNEDIDFIENILKDHKFDCTIEKVFRGQITKQQAMDDILRISEEEYEEKAKKTPFNDY